MNDRKLILNLIKKHAVKIAEPNCEFTLASGEKSRIYLDIKKAIFHHSAHIPLANLLYEQISSGTFGVVKAVAGVAIGGCHLASVASLIAALNGNDLNVLYIRKETKDHGTKSLVEGIRNKTHKKVLLLEDVITTGQSSIKAMHQLEDAGYSVAGTLAIADRRAQSSNMLNALPCKSLFSIGEIIEL